MTIFKQVTRKRIISILAVIALLIFAWNQPYVFWHLWTKWKFTDKQSLYFIPETVVIERQKIPQNDWCYVDFLEVKLHLPRDTVKINKVGDTGISICYNDFYIAITDFLGGRNNQKWIANLKEIATDSNVSHYVPDSYYRLLVEQALLTPHNLMFFKGFSETNKKIFLLKSKHGFFRSVSKGFIFKTDHIKGIFVRKSDGRNYVVIFSMDEKHSFTVNLIFKETSKLLEHERDILLSDIIRNIQFSNDSPVLQSVKSRIDEIIKSRVLPCK